MAELLTLASGHHQQCHCRIILSIPTPLPLCFLSVIGSIPLFLILMNLLDQLQQFFQEITLPLQRPCHTLAYPGLLPLSLPHFVNLTKKIP